MLSLYKGVHQCTCDKFYRTSTYVDDTCLLGRRDSTPLVRTLYRDGSFAYSYGEGVRSYFYRRNLLCGVVLYVSFRLSPRIFSFIESSKAISLANALIVLKKFNVSHSSDLSRTRTNKIIVFQVTILLHPNRVRERQAIVPVLLLSGSRHFFLIHRMQRVFHCILASRLIMNVRKAAVKGEPEVEYPFNQPSSSKSKFFESLSFANDMYSISYIEHLEMY